MSPPLPRITIRFCTQCHWLLRAAYYAQELLSTFHLALGEVALQPATGGTFTITLFDQGAEDTTTTETVLWDRAVDGAFPETKELKRRVRDLVQPGRSLGHVDRQHPREVEGKAHDGDGRGEAASSGGKGANDAGAEGGVRVRTARVDGDVGVV